MEISLSPKIDTNFNNVCGILLKIENAFSTPIKHRNTVIKYTKLSDLEFENKVLRPQQSCSQLRRFTTLDNEEHITSRSLKSDLLLPKKMTSVLPKRKIVTISEDDENFLHPKFARKIKSCSVRILNKSVATDYKDEKCSSSRNICRLSISSKFTKEPTTKSKINNTHIVRESNVLKPANSRKCSNIKNTQLEHGKSQHGRHNGMRQNSKISKSSISKNTITSDVEQDLSIVNSKLLENFRSNMSLKKSAEKSRTDNSSSQIKNKATFLTNIQSKNKPVTVIHVPLDEKYNKQKKSGDNDIIAKTNHSIDMNNVNKLNHMNVGTEPLASVDQATDMNEFEFRKIESYFKSTELETEVAKETFDNLEIPNVSLTKEKSDFKEFEDRIDYKSQPNIQMPSISLSTDEVNNNTNELNYCTSYIISRATLTCTTQQKINFHMVESKDTAPLMQSSSPLSYPLTVVSVLHNEMKRNKQCNNEKVVCDVADRSLTETEQVKCLNEYKSFNCSYAFDNNKLMKPSEIIRSIKINTGFMQREYISEQFQRELNFIDSFYESLQYLENTSLSKKCLVNENVDSITCNSDFFKNVLQAKTSEYDHFFTKLDNNCNIDNTETMTTKSLCLLNSLIRDEQRRAKNLLFVLKMREDALKDFATSQILWLENKKKHDNTDVSVLKKKQRGALLKLQHEFGEMQRMRKALLTLSERRKVALLKTKKSLELKLKKNVDVDQIAIGKKKLKKNIFLDRNTAPLKCFDLSSSGCEESSPSRHNTDNVVFDPECQSVVASIKSAEKSIQTGDSVIGSLFVDESADTAAENCVVVDGGYLNILFHNLSLPQIFSGGKKYEVNEEALKNIVNSSNSPNSDINKDNIVEKFMDQSNDRDTDISSSPSTARSLVEEFDNYYKSLGEKTAMDSSEQELTTPGIVFEVKDTSVQLSKIEQNNSPLFHYASTMASDSADTIATTNNVSSIDQSCMCEISEPKVELAYSIGKEDVTTLSQTGPLTVPVGASAQTDISGADRSVWPILKTTATSTVSDSNEDIQPVCLSIPSMTSLTSPVHYEVEELRRQQLAIEREIKALEQQQCQLMAVREIPDKPPPPYTPPADSKTSKSPRKFVADEKSKEQIKNIIIDSASAAIESNDSFDLFLKDFCQESLERHVLEQSDKPWDACNLLPQKQQCDTEKLVQRTSSELSEILTGVTPTVVSGVGARRSDHIDDILFAEWRRCEPEWTSLHTEEASVKNQIFDCIFQKILTETVDEYKKIVKSDITTKS